MVEGDALFERYLDFVMRAVDRKPRLLFMVIYILWMFVTFFIWIPLMFGNLFHEAYREWGE